MNGEDKQEKNKYSVEVLGQELTVIGENISEDYVKKLAFYINEIGEEIDQAYPQLPRRRILGLTLINITDDFYKNREKLKNLVQENKKLKNENKKLKNKNEKLKSEIESLKEEYEELSILLEEVDD